mmetsp:Transcript_47754/g.136389  ORF Transcript_47754/g.136389 Transcript_47754/m.136389 type:complete len:542 (+) Transcript_47754:117-1742(+)
MRAQRGHRRRTWRARGRRRGTRTRAYQEQRPGQLSRRGPWPASASGCSAGTGPARALPLLSLQERESLRDPLVLLRVGLRLLPALEPAAEVVVQPLLAGLQGRQPLHGLLGQGHHKELEEAQLGVGQVHGLAVIERLHGQTQGLLEVALQEELLEEERGPVLAQPPGLHGVGDVGEVKEGGPHELAHVWGRQDVHHLGRGAGLPVAEVRLHGHVQGLRVDLHGHLELLHHGEVVLVVRAQDGVDADLARLAVGERRQPREDLVARAVRELEEPRAVHVFQWRLVVVPDRQLVGRLDEEGVVEPRMPYVVPDGTDHQREALMDAEEVLRAGHGEAAEQREGHVGRVDPAVVADLLGIAVGLGRGLHEPGLAGPPLRARARPVALALRQQQRAELETHGRLQLRGVEVPALEAALQRPPGARGPEVPLPALRRAVLAQEVPQQRALALAELLELVDGHLLHGDVAQRRQLPEDDPQNLHLAEEARALVPVRPVLAVVAPVLAELGCHLIHRAENVSCHRLHTVQEPLQGHKDNPRHRMRHERG